MQEKRLYAILSSSYVLRRLALGAAGLLALGAGAADVFTLVAPGTRARVLVGADEPEYVFRAAQDFTNDVKKITGADLALTRGNTPQPGDVFIATSGGSRSCATDKEWESYDVTVKSGVLTVAGSDARGTMFGLYDFIERYLKVDPLAFWNGVPYPKATLAWDAVEIHQPSPTFKFRGWFINDEDYLSQWREPAGPRPVRTAKGICSVVINHGTMEAIAEAMVRSRFNLIIPCSYIDPRVDYEAENLAICARRGLFLSQHHHDPLGLGGFMFLNHWESKGKDYKYSYFSHPREVEDMWREAARAYAKFPDVVWQIGFRGISDTPMWAADKSVPTSDVARAQIISDAMAKQVEILKEIGVAKPYLTATLWGEGAVFNEKGFLKVPDGATVVYSDNSSGWWWPKDFYETPQDAKHTYGLYYHHQLITAGPHFVPGVPAARTFGQLKEAADRHATEYVVFNVGNVREFTYGIAASQAMTWNLGAFDAEAWTKDWIARRFSTQRAEWLSLHNLYFKSFQRHPVHGHPMFLDGHLAHNVWRLLRRDFVGALAARKKGKNTFPFEPMTNSYARAEKLDAFKEALYESNHPVMATWHDTYARLRAQEASFAQTERLARTLMSRAPAAEQDLAFDAFVYPAAFMHAFTRGMAEFADAFDLYALGDTSGAAAAAQRGLAALESAEALDARYCRGKWTDWHKCRVQVPFPKIIEQARDLITNLTTR